MPVITLVARRVMAACVLLVAAVSVSWLLVRAAPGDAGDTLPGERLTAAARAAERAQAGVEGSALGSLASWWSAAVRLDFGTSVRYQRPVLPLVLERMSNSAMLTGCALAFALLVGLPLGSVSARSSGWPAHLIRFSSVVLLSVPPLVLALLLTWAAVRAGWSITPPRPRLGAPPSEHVTALARALLLPTLSLALPLCATFERLQSRSLARVAGAPCLRAAAARGLDPSVIWHRHAWRLALPPVASVGGVIAGALLGGALTVEVVTAWPGLGRLAFDALVARDAPLVAGCAAATASLVSLASLAADLVVAWADPRAREAA